MVAASCVALAASAAALMWQINNTKVATAAQIRLVRDTRQRAENGDALAQAELGSIYLRGLTVEQDDVQALFWYRKSAEQGSDEGECGLAWMYLQGTGVPQDYQESLRWYQMAANKGSASGENGLAYMYSDGLGVPLDYTRAYFWYSKAAEQGNAKAEYNLGNMYYYGRGVTQNREEAARWLKKAAMDGDEYARRALGQQPTAIGVIFLAIQALAGVILTSRSLLLKTWDHDLRDRVATCAGLLCLLAAGLTWYGYQHNMIWRRMYGTTTFTLLMGFLDSIVVVIIVYLALSRVKASTARA